jgi:mRNA-degrading endonuclease RelE of RelBE toxin-antitoxin system
LTFDPLEFAGLKAKEQVAALLEVVDLDIDLPKVIEDRAKYFDERTEVNREHKRLSGVLSSLAEPEKDTPKEEVSSVELFNKIEAAQELHRGKEDIQSTLAHAEILRIEKLSSLKRAEEELKSLDENIGKLRKDFVNVIVPDIKALQDELGNLEETNAKVRKAKEYRVAFEALDEAQIHSAHFTDSIDELDKLKTDAISRAKMPVDGLSFDEEGLTFDGIPFAQVSSAEQLRISTAMAMAANPKLKVIRITDGSLLDSDSMKIIEKLADDNDYQVWIEVVSDTGKVGIYIEDGEIKRQDDE